MNQQVQNFALKIFTASFLTISLIAWFSCKKNTPSQIQLGESAGARFIFTNLNDSIKLNIYNFPVLNSSGFNKTELIFPGEKQKLVIFPCECPTHVDIIIGNKSYFGYVIPKDTIEINVTFSDSSGISDISFKGKTASIFNFYIEKQQILGYDDLRISLNQVTQNPDDILRNTDSLLNAELAYFINYTSKTGLPDWFLKTEKSQILYLCNSFKYSHEAYITKRLKKTFTPGADYYKSVDTLKINNPDAIYSYWYYSFLKSHLVHKNLNLEGLNTKEWIDLTTKTAINKAESNLSGEIRDVFVFGYFYNYLKWTKNLSDFDSLFDAYNTVFTNHIYTDALTRFRKELTDSIVSGRNDEFGNVSEKQIKANDPVPYFYLPDATGKYFTPADLKDKIVYINFWATWCKPCISSIEDKNRLIEKFRNHGNVVFLNICVSSEKEKWESIVTEKQLGGINLFANENWTTLIEQNFGISAFPSYFLTKNDSIVKPFCDGPLNIEDDIRILLK